MYLRQYSNKLAYLSLRAGHIFERRVKWQEKNANTATIGSDEREEFARLRHVRVRVRLPDVSYLIRFDYECVNVANQ